MLVALGMTGSLNGRVSTVQYWILQMEGSSVPEQNRVQDGLVDKTARGLNTENIVLLVRKTFLSQIKLNKQAGKFVLPLDGKIPEKTLNGVYVASSTVQTFFLHFVYQGV